MMVPRTVAVQITTDIRIRFSLEKVKSTDATLFPRNIRKHKSLKKCTKSESVLPTES